MGFRFFLVFISALLVFSQAAQSQDAPLSKEPERSSEEPSAKDKESPTVITADSVEAKQNQVIEATGNAELRKDDQMIRADHILYLQQSNEVFADGAVRIEKTDTSVSGPSLRLNLNNDTGEMAQPSFILNDVGLRGDAEVLRIEGKQLYNFKKASYTSCPAGNDDWLLKMGELELDRDRQIGTAYNARIEFMGVPILYTPWMNFPLIDQRRSGLLAPVKGRTKTGGYEITVPFYWNISNNYDATFSPRFIDKRGTLYNNEFRYLGNSYAGKIDYGVLQDDKIAKINRSHSSIKHNQNLGSGFTAALNLNEASDDAYFRDLSVTPGIATQKHLLREGLVSYGGGWWNTSIRAQSYQTLQDPKALVVPPYSRLPQVNLGAQRVMGGAAVNLNAEFVAFDHLTLVNGNRTVVYPSVSYPLVRDPGYYITPKLGLHNTQYSLGINNPGTNSQYGRSIPILSLDSGMTLERDFTAYENEYVQTLEPRIYYVKIPYKQQDMLPIFDSARAPFSFPQMFTENRFLGSDRIGDADQVTAAVTSRFLGADTGSELLRVAIGQRFSSITPRVVLGASTATTNKSDVLMSVGGRMSSTLSLDSLAQYNPDASRTEMFAATARYRPEVGKVFNLGYRYTLNIIDPAKSLRQVDFSTQWLLGGRWHMVGQMKYSLHESRTVEALAGLEYNQDCWALRLVAQQFALSTSLTSTSYFIQLELKEMIRVGNDPLSTLKRSVPGYTVLSDRPRDKAKPSVP